MGTTLMHRVLQEEDPAAVPYVKDTETTTRVLSLNGAHSWIPLDLLFLIINKGLKTNMTYW